MTKQITLTIGIPAHNEEANIKNLLANLLRQKTNGFELKEIIVYSDGSTDQTISQAKLVLDSKIKVIDSKNRQGKNTTQNKIFKRASSDILLIMDADILPENINFLNSMVNVFIQNEDASLVAAKVLPVFGGSLVSEVLAHSQNLKLLLSEKIAKIKPIYICNGRAMAYSNKLYKNLEIPEKLLADDAYSCLVCIQKGNKIYYQDSVGVLYQVPSTIEDHLKQSTRFFNGRAQLSKIFGASFIEDQYKIPVFITSQIFVNGLCIDFRRTLFYIAILITSKLLSIFNKDKLNHKWEMATSSKKLINHYD